MNSASWWLRADFFRRCGGFRRAGVFGRVRAAVGLRLVCAIHATSRRETLLLPVPRYDRSVEPLSYAFEDRLLILDGLAVELFARIADGSKRYPVAWLAVRFEDRKDDKVRVHIGQGQEGSPFYSDDVTVSSFLGEFDVPQSEVAGLRAFFDEAARRAGRAT
jgi:hypothetical protein